MRKIYLKLILTIAPALLLLGWVTILTVQIYSGKEVALRIKGYDPRSLLSGHYIQYQIDWENSDCGQFENGVCPRVEFNRAFFSGYWGNSGRFYVSEKQAADLDRAVRSDDNVAEIVYSYRKGQKPYARRLLINGKTFEGK